MASINGISLKNVKEIPAIEKDGLTAYVYVDNKRIGRYKNYGDGATGIFYGNAVLLRDKMKEFYQKQPDFDSNWVYMHTPDETELAIEDGNLPTSHDYDEDIDRFVERLWSFTKAEQRFRKAIATNNKAYVDVSFPYKNASISCPDGYGYATNGSDDIFYKIYYEAKSKKLVTAKVVQYDKAEQFNI